MMATDSKTGLLNKPCSACRRRKVRCDKLQPCTNCSKHGWTCLYDSEGGAGPSAAPGAGAGDQGALQDRLERLERMLEEISVGDTVRSRRLAMERELRNEGGAGGSGGGAGPGGGNDGGGGAARPERDGIQVFEPHTSYFMGENYWMALHSLIYEPRCLLRVEYDDSSGNSWPFLAPLPPNLSHMHLPQDKEAVLIDGFYELVEPFIKITHQPSFRADLAEFRRGACQFEREFEALLFSMQLMAAMAMPTVLVQQRLGQDRKELMAHLRTATEMALSRANVLRSRKTAVFQALLCYITYLYYTCQSEIASTMLGLASRIGMRMGLHRDPRQYSFPPWVSEIRRRLWNHFMLMDSQLFTGEGFDAGIGLTTNVGRSANANDDDWGPPRFRDQQGSGPADRDGFTDMTFVILRDEILNTMRKWARMRAAGESAAVLARMLDETQDFLVSKFLDDVDDADPMQLVADARFKAHYGYVRLFIQFNAARSSRQSNLEQQALLLRHSIEMLEMLETSETIAREHNWGWLYNWPVPWSALAFTLTGLVHQLDHPDVDRAWHQIDVCFRRHMNAEVQIDRLPAWKAIERLCDQAMYYHPDRNHAGAAYTRRATSPRSSQSPPSVGQSLPGSTGPGSAIAPTAGVAASVGPESFFGDMGLFSLVAPPDPDLTMAHLFAPPAAPGPSLHQHHAAGVSDPQQRDTMMYPSAWPPPPPPPPPSHGTGFPPGYR